MTKIINKTYDELKGKREGQINWRIRKIKADIRRAVYQLEIPRWDMSEERAEGFKILTENNLRSLREDLFFAQKALVDTGYKYCPDRFEQRSAEFDRQLDQLVEITLKYGNADSGYDTVKVLISNGNAEITAYNTLSQPKGNLITVDKNLFIKSIKELKVGEWKKNYGMSGLTSCSLDGESWCLTFYFSDGVSKVFGGENVRPYNYGSLLEILGV